MTRARLPWTRIGFVGLVAASLALGGWGLALDTADVPGRTWFDVFYYDLQLFVLGADPASDGGALSWQLQTARFVAPAAAVWAIVEAVRALFAERLRRMRERRTKGHAIVVGQTDAADAVADALRTGGHTVLRATEQDDLDDAGLRGAAVLYACSDDSSNPSVNVLTVTGVANTVRRRGRGPERLYAHVSDPDLAVALQARHLASATTGVDFFTLDVLAAQSLAAREAESLAAASAVAVIGSGDLARALVVALAGEWELVSGVRRRLKILLVADDAPAVAEELSSRWGAVTDSCDLQAVTSLPDSAVLDRMYVCPDDEDAALHTTLTNTALWHGAPGSLVLVLDRLSGLAGVFDGDGTRVLDDLDGRLRTVVVHDLLAHTRHPEPRVHDDVYERLARAVHHVYLRNQLERGVVWASTPAMRRWENLTDDLRESNRRWVVGLPDRLARVGGTIAPRDGGTDVAISGPMLDRLAMAEHDLWEAVRLELGWRHGPVRDDAKRLHPMIGVSWEDLPEPEKEKDRDLIRNLPEILAEFGLELVFYDR
ncbi:RyR domain-containing protein [Myceligenerans xiligouense]|uniref:RyR domain-containing protein n=1 Tax=Myceligenerans xiligouense TaxID=253184 RepID=A0A3N4ZKD3_9MICO|nr:RyR domain-containing protein [Myceligenerans xiligouense]RPF21385.1 RyR domain-containing protein [Myceligenerans xiligouense]